MSDTDRNDMIPFSFTGGALNIEEMKFSSQIARGAFP